MTNVFHFFSFCTKTGSDLWKERLDGVIKSSDLFFSDNPKDVMTEVACEPVNNCNVDQRSFKAYLARWMAGTIKVAPYTRDRLMPRLRASAQAAAKQCSGPDNACGLQWTKLSQYDGSTGIGEQMAALEVIQANLIDTVGPPANNKTGTSKGDPNAGTGPGGSSSQPASEITTGDRVGAGFVTCVMLLLIFGGVWWMIS